MYRNFGEKSSNSDNIKSELNQMIYTFITKSNTLIERIELDCVICSLKKIKQIIFILYDNEENETIELQYSDDENIEIESAQNEPAINFDNEQNKLNEIEIEFLMLEIDNSMSLILLQIKIFWDKNINNLNQIRYTPQYLDKLFLNNFKIKGQFFKNENYDHSIFYFEIKNDLVNLLNKNHFFQRIDFDTDFENGIYTNFKSGEQFKSLKNKNKNKIEEQYQRVTTLNMVKIFNSVDKLKSIEDESTTLIMGNKINNPDNINNIKLKIDSLFKKYQYLTFHTSIKNNKEVYNVGDAIEVASDNVLSGRWAGIINSILMVDMGNNIIKHSILLNYFEKFDGDQFNKYHFLSNQLNYITYDNIINNIIPVQINAINYLIIYNSPNGNSSILNQSPIHQRTKNSSNMSTGDESFHNNFSLSNEIGLSTPPTPINNQRIVTRRVQRPTDPLIQEPDNQMTDNPHVPLEYILAYEYLLNLCKKQLCKVSPLFIAGIILQAGGKKTCPKSHNIDAQLKKWVNNKINNTRSKVAESLSNYSKGNKNHLLKVYISDNQNFAGNEILILKITKTMFSLKQFVDSCKIGEEKQWYHDSVPLNKLLISIFKDFSKKFDAGEKLRKDAQACFEFGETPLYLNNSNSSQ
ncbi:hypothetical protein ACTFIY_008858 [Dictyostelium cf. discoideum]